MCDPKSRNEDAEANHYKRAIYAAKCKKIVTENNIPLVIPEKFLFDAFDLAEFWKHESYILIYKKLDLVTEQDFLSIDDSQLQDYANIVAQFVRLTTYCNIHQKKFSLDYERRFGIN